eukprot:GHVS01056259.1.p1 GENE.GHVS01056259.1~~GHVS01056259.1.p1  ORF type:complete len:1186 (+),score=200.93 GHVS01056259.1:3854-7411(+)
MVQLDHVLRRGDVPYPDLPKYLIGNPELLPFSCIAVNVAGDTMAGASGSRIWIIGMRSRSWYATLDIPVTGSTPSTTDVATSGGSGPGSGATGCIVKMDFTCADEQLVVIVQGGTGGRSQPPAPRSSPAATPSPPPPSLQGNVATDADHVGGVGGVVRPERMLGLSIYIWDLMKLPVQLVLCASIGEILRQLHRRYPWLLGCSTTHAMSVDRSGNNGRGDRRRKGPEWGAADATGDRWEQAMEEHSIMEVEEEAVERERYFSRSMMGGRKDSSDLGKGERESSSPCGSDHAGPDYTGSMGQPESLLQWRQRIQEETQCIDSVVFGEHLTGDANATIESERASGYSNHVGDRWEGTASGTDGSGIAVGTAESYRPASRGRFGSPAKTAGTEGDREETKLFCGGANWELTKFSVLTVGYSCLAHKGGCSSGRHCSMRPYLEAVVSVRNQPPVHFHFQVHRRGQASSAHHPSRTKRRSAAIGVHDRTSGRAVVDDAVGRVTVPHVCPADSTAGQRVSKCSPPMSESADAVLPNTSDTCKSRQVRCCCCSHHDQGYLEMDLTYCVLSPYMLGFNKGKEGGFPFDVFWRSEKRRLAWRGWEHWKAGLQQEEGEDDPAEEEAEEMKEERKKKSMADAFSKYWKCGGEVKSPEEHCYGYLADLHRHRVQRKRLKASCPSRASRRDWNSRGAAEGGICAVDRTADIVPFSGSSVIVGLSKGPLMGVAMPCGLVVVVDLFLRTIWGSTELGSGGAPQEVLARSDGSLLMIRMAERMVVLRPLFPTNSRLREATLNWISTTDRTKEEEGDAEMREDSGETRLVGGEPAVTSRTRLELKENLHEQNGGDGFWCLCLPDETEMLREGREDDDEVGQRGCEVLGEVEVELKVQFSYHDPVQREKYETCCFSQDDLLDCIAVTAERMGFNNLYLFDLMVESGIHGMRVKADISKSNGFRQLLWQTGESALLGLNTRGGNVVALHPTRRDAWVCFVPGFELLDKNREIVETEDEFDDLIRADLHQYKFLSNDGRRFVRRMKTNLSRGDAVKLPMANPSLTAPWFPGETGNGPARYKFYDPGYVLRGEKWRHTSSSDDSTGGESEVEEKNGENVTSPEGTINGGAHEGTKREATKGCGGVDDGLMGLKGQVDHRKGFVCCSENRDSLDIPGREVLAATPALLYRYRYMMTHTDYHTPPPPS